MIHLQSDCRNSRSRHGCLHGFERRVSHEGGGVWFRTRRLGCTRHRARRRGTRLSDLNAQRDHYCRLGMRPKISLPNFSNNEISSHNSNQEGKETIVSESLATYMAAAVPPKLCPPTASFLFPRAAKSRRADSNPSY